MKKNMNLCLYLMMIAIAIHPAYAMSGCGTFSSANLYKICNTGMKTAGAGKATDNADDAYNSGTCLGYIKGFIYLEIAYSATLAVIKNPNATEEDIRKKSLFCLPDKIVNKNLAQVYLDYMDQHPEDETKAACESLLNALKQTYPCK